MSYSYCVFLMHRNSPPSTVWPPGELAPWRWCRDFHIHPWQSRGAEIPDWLEGTQALFAPDSSAEMRFMGEPGPIPGVEGMGADQHGCFCCGLQPGVAAGSQRLILMSHIQLSEKKVRAAAVQKTRSFV